MRFSGIDKVFSRMQRLQDRVDDPSEPFATAGQKLVESLQTNIDSGGRPTAFKPLAESTLASRRRRGTGDKPLYDTGAMRDGIRFIPHGDSEEAGSDAV